jgi:hypothetical protein
MLFNLFRNKRKGVSVNPLYFKIKGVSNPLPFHYHLRKDGFVQNQWDMTLTLRSDPVVDGGLC